MKEVEGISNPLSASFTKWSNTLEQFVGKLPTNCSVFDHFGKSALKGLSKDAGHLSDSNEIQARYHLVRKRTLSYLAKRL